MKLFYLMLCGFALSGGGANAQSQQTESSIRIERSVGVTTMARMAFAAEASAPPMPGDPPKPGEASMPGSRNTTSSAPAVIQVTGDPGRTYRINLPASLRAPMTNATIGHFNVWSQNSGDISETLTSQMDDRGQDTLRVTGVLSAVTFENVTADMPITVNYE